MTGNDPYLNLLQLLVAFVGGWAAEATSHLPRWSSPRMGGAAGFVVGFALLVALGYALNIGDSVRLAPTALGFCLGILSRRWRAAASRRAQ